MEAFVLVMYLVHHHLFVYEIFLYNLVTTPPLEVVELSLSLFITEHLPSIYRHINYNNYISKKY